ncbi:antibiotic biosynthesis monooxygenase family protein [Desulfoferrobacter suflitae]|uniref:antibiotic biosynthesis monooxygenase family protein n=1 Tax=Desulfoferrobacter suflitae TaxID=2865782 RepID=UPI00216479EC|nr:antibiotic biosynthesis monooxygenase [Desulfoferrobacter suflitae]MCK8600879.1 antibiotic biosynthesis monooxygenase [Desulfoferrobacter suflitae]
MAVRVLIEREIEPGHELQLHQLLLQLRAKAMQVKGYISGETLRALEDPNKFLVISTWSSLDEWKNWESNSDRKRIEEQISRLLRAPEKTAIYSYI